MNWKSRTLIAATALLLTLPAGAATWSAYGSYEPSTPYDEPSLMFQDATQVPGVKRVYFNAYTMVLDALVTGSTVNPNVAALETRNEAPASEWHEAVLGVWTDCNKDGYIGMAEGAVREYSAALLTDTSACPPSGGSNQKFNGAHNYNGLVTELIPIMREASPRDARRFVDPEARVWGDFDRPDEKPTRRSCALTPLPRGTLETTGGTLNYVDCRVDVLGTANLALDLVGNPAGLKFADEDDGDSSALGKISPLGSEDSSKSPATVWDCSGGESGYVFRGGDTLNKTLGENQAKTFNRSVHNIAIYGVAPSVGNTQDPTLPGFYNATREGLEGANGDSDGGSCDTSNDRGADFYGTLEDDFNGVNPKRKSEADWNFQPVGVLRGGAPVSVIPGGSGSAGMNENDYGLSLGGPSGARWVSDSVFLTKPGPQTVKADLGSGDVNLAGAYWLSFYAYLSPAITDQAKLPGGTPLKYGAWHCGANTDGIHNGWVCDPDDWYVNQDGTRLPDEGSFLARPGDPYNLRDVDCYDGSTNVGIGLGAAFYGAAPCP